MQDYESIMDHLNEKLFSLPYMRVKLSGQNTNKNLQYNEFDDSVDPTPPPA